MTFRVQGEIKVNGTQAKAEAKAVATELRKVGTDATGMGRATGAAGDGARRLGAGSADAAAKVRALAAAERQAATDAVTMGRGNQMAAGSVGNLTAQFNDIGVMLAAGQNPLQLAIQQGTQITQVFGNMGAASAVSALGAAFKSLFSLTNIATIGGIAAGAALFQWLTTSAEEAVTFEDALQELETQTEAYAKANARASASTEELQKQWGSAAGQARIYLRELAQIEERETQRAGRRTATSLKESLGVDSGSYRLDDRETLGDLFGVDFFSGNILGGEAFRSLLDQIINSLDTIETATSIDAQISAAETLRARFQEAAEAVGGISEEEDVALRSINEMILGLQRFREEQRAAQAALAEANGRFAGAEAAKQALDYRLAEETAIRAANAAAQEMVATLQAEEVVRNQILIFGRDSELVAQNRLAAEREVLAAQLEAEGVAADLAARVLEAWDAATGFNAEAAGMPGFLSAAAGAAAGIAGNLWNAVKAQVTLKANEQAYAQMKLAADGKVYSGRGGDPRTANQQGYGRFVYTGPTLDALNNIKPGRSGGGKAARDEADAVADLIEKLRGEVDAARELDPVQRAMIGYREQLKNATAAERAEVEGLIVQREREKQLTESLNWLGEQTGDALIDGLMGAADAGERLIDTLKRAVLQALILGNGPLGGLFGGGLFGGGGGGGLFGGGGGGGLFGGLFSGGGLFAGLAEGGMVFGDGGPRDDKVVRRLSAGEFVVNAAATRRHRRLLEAINAPGLANGGAVGGGGAAGGAMALGGSTFNAHFDLRGASDPAEVETAARRGMKAALDEYRRTGLAGDVRRSLDRPEVLRF